MKSQTPLITGLRAAAVAVLALGLGLWAATGAHRGWTQTSKVTLKQDEVTGIEYPVRESAFVAGVEVLGAAVLGAAALGGSSVLLGRRRSTQT